MQRLNIREALRGECPALSELALRSKAHWGYSQAFLESCRGELTVDASRLGDADFYCFVAGNDTAIAGFYALRAIDKECCELEALFVEPQQIGRGVGRLLVQDAIRLASGLGATRLTIQGDPNASGFYAAAGARQVGQRESGSIPGRCLPLFEIDLRIRDSGCRFD